MTQAPNPFASPQTTSVPLPGEHETRTDYPAEMRRVRTGLTLVYYGICGILLLAIAIPLLSTLLLRNAVAGGAPGGVAVGSFALLGVLGLAMLALFILMLVGEVLCIAVPAESGAKGLVTASVAMQAVSILANLAMQFGIDSTVGPFVSAAGSLLNLASMVCFVLFLRKTALYIHRDDIARRALRTLIVGVVSLVLLIGVVAAMGYTAAMLPPATTPPLLIVLAALGGLTGLVAFLMYANTITYLRKAIKL